MQLFTKFARLAGRKLDAVLVNGRLRLALMQVEFWLIGWVRFSDSCLAVLKLISPPDEFVRYLRFRQHWDPLSLLLPVTSLIIVAKRGYFPFYLSSLTPRPVEQHPSDGSAPRQVNLSRTARGALVSYGDCLVTDCQVLDGAGQYKLPLFAMCQPELSHYYNPYVGLGVPGVVMDLCFTYHAYIFGIALPLFLYLRRCRDEIYMFVVCPRTISAFRCKRLQAYIRDFYGSFLNYYRYVLQDYKQRTHKLSTFSSDLRRTTDPSLRGDDLRSMAERQIVQREAQRYSEFDRRLDELSSYAWSCIEDCSSEFRSGWWQLIAMRQLNLFTVVAALIQVFVVVLLDVITRYLISARRGELAQLSRLIQSTGCLLRLRRQHGADNTRLDLTQYLAGEWHWAPLAEVLIVLATSIYSTSTILATFCVIYNDAISLIAEQLDRIWLVIELTAHIDPRQDIGEPSLHWHSDAYKFHDLKLMHRRRVERSRYVYCLRTSNYHSIAGGAGAGETPRRLVQRLAGEQQRRPVDLDNYCTLLARIYACNRALFGKANDLSLALSSVLGAFVAWSQGLIVLIIIFNKSSDQSNMLPTVFALLGILLCSFLISFPSQFQVESRQIVKLMLRLLAHTAHLDDIRVGHARDLWLRQVESISENNGLTLIAFGVPITYATTIRLALVSLTMITIWLN